MAAVEPSLAAAPPVDPVCDCPEVGGCTNVWCTSGGGCPSGSRCDPDSGFCAVIPHCEQAAVVGPNSPAPHDHDFHDESPEPANSEINNPAAAKMI